MDEEKIQQFYVDDETLSLIVEALLIKIKENVNNVVNSSTVDDTVWNTILNGLTNGIVDPEDLGNRPVSIELLAQLIAKGKLLSYELVTGKEISEVVTDPKANVIYLLKDPDAVEPNLVSMWMNISADDQPNWISLGGVKLPEINYVDTESPDSVKNIVAHVRRAETDYTGSANVQPGEIVTAQALTNVLISLGYASKVVIPFEKGQGKTISEVVGKPDVTAFYVYQQSADENDWACYTAAPIINGDTTKYVWLKISGAEGTTVEVDLSNYWSKDELKPITAEKVTEIVDAAAEKVGF